MKKRVFFGVYKFRNIVVNACIVLLLAVIAAVAFLGGNEALVTTTASGAYYCGNREGNKVSLMINVYWGTEYIDDMLEVLHEKDVKATFFLGGMWVLDNEELVTKIFDGGHELANHGYKHKNQDSLTYQQGKTEIQTTHDLIFKMTGFNMTLFAPPSGAYNDQTIEVAKELNYKTILWSRDTIDWRDHDADVIYNRAINGVKAGDLILMHPTQETLQALPRIIDYILQQGLSFDTVSNCLI